MQQSAYEATRRLAGPVLAFALEREAEELMTKAAQASNKRAALTLLKQGPLRLTLVAVKSGAVLETHKADGPITISTIRGSIRVTTEGNATMVPAGNLIAIEAGLDHLVEAAEDSAFLLTLSMPEGRVDRTPAGSEADAASGRPGENQLEGGIVS